MADTCRAPDGSAMWTLGLGSKTTTMVLVMAIACTPILTLLLGPKLLFRVGSIFGYYLRKKSARRKAQILEMVEADEKKFAAEGGDRRDSDEWENVEAYTTGTSSNGEAAGKEWDGIIGFFHPFWYEFPVLWQSCC